MKDIAQAMLKEAQKRGLPVYFSKQFSEMNSQERNQYAEGIRQQNIDSCKYFLNYPGTNKKDLQYTIMAYQQMTNDEIILSQEREDEVRHKGTQDFIDKLRQYQEESKKVTIIAKTKSNKPFTTSPTQEDLRPTAKENHFAQSILDWIRFSPKPNSPWAKIV